MKSGRLGCAKKLGRSREGVSKKGEGVSKKGEGVGRKGKERKRLLRRLANSQ